MVSIVIHSIDRLFLFFPKKENVTAKTFGHKYRLPNALFSHEDVHMDTTNRLYMGTMSDWRLAILYRIFVV
jgi:hypothetical protein